MTLLTADFDVIVVGAGPAGAACALGLTRAKASVLVLEKGKTLGEKNVGGTILYGESGPTVGLGALVPDYETAAPLERRIISHEVTALGEPDRSGGRFSYYRLTKNSLAARLGVLSMGAETDRDYSLLRGPFDRWFGGLAVDAGASISMGTWAEDLILEGRSVQGVRTSKESLRSKVVVDCSGVTSSLVEKAGLRKALVPRQLYHAVKRVYGLDEEAIDKRFRVRSGEGRSMSFIGSFMNGVDGGAFVHTNRSTLSVGVVASLDSLVRVTTEHFDRVGGLQDLLDGFVEHPAVAELLEGAVLLESSSHNIPKGYKCLLKQPHTDGFMAAGDALGAFVKVGPTADGMRHAISSGSMAAKAFVGASSSGSYKARNLSRYKEMLAPVYEEVNTSGRDSFISESSWTFHLVPKLIFKTRFLARTRRFPPGDPPTSLPSNDGTTKSLASTDPGVDSSKIVVDLGRASQSISKPWIPACPGGCFSLVTSGGEYVSFRTLYQEIRERAVKEGMGSAEARRRAFSETRAAIASGRLGFGGSGCVGCGNCGAIGPKTMVLYSQGTGGSAASYKYG